MQDVVFSLKLGIHCYYLVTDSMILAEPETRNTLLSQQFNRKLTKKNSIKLKSWVEEVCSNCRISGPHHTTGTDFWSRMSHVRLEFLTTVPYGALASAHARCILRSMVLIVSSENTAVVTVQARAVSPWTEYRASSMSV